MLPDAGCRHFGVLPFTGTGHLNPMLALGQELKERGHRVTVFEKAKAESRVRDYGLEFCSIGGNHRFSKPPNRASADPGLWSDLSKLGFNIRRVTHDLKVYLSETPESLWRAGVDALIVNEIAWTGPTVAELLNLPYFLISTSVPHNFGWNPYPWWSGYRRSSSSVSLAESALLELSALRMRGPILWALDNHRQRLGLSKSRLLKTFPPLAHITQLPECMDLPRRSLPAGFHYTGPFSREVAATRGEFPWHQLDGRPIIYACLGTTRNVQPEIYGMIAEACQDREQQLVISLGGRFAPEQFEELPGRPLVVRFAPQLELLKIARLVITHAGPNTAFEALLEGKPMVAIPLAHDQPAIAARLARLHVAEVLPVMRLSSQRIKAAVSRVLNCAEYSAAAARVQKTLLATRGKERAASIIEDSLRKYAAGQ